MSESDRMVRLNASDYRFIPYLSETPDAVWGDVIGRDQDTYLDLCREFYDLVFSTGIQSFLARKVAWYLHTFHYENKGYYIRESDWFSQQSNGILSPSQMAFIQRSYTWAHFGCSTVCIWDEDVGENVCMRSLDWDGAQAIGKATRVFEFQDEGSNKVFKTAGIVGMVGVLTGVRNGFCVVINYAPGGKSVPDEHADPTFKLRLLLENKHIDTYEEAKGAICNWEVSAPVFITLCGVLKDQACVIEIGSTNTKHIVESKEGILVQTNHHDVQSPFENVEMKSVPVDEDGNTIDNWYYSELLSSSQVRQLQLKEALTRTYESSSQLDWFLENQYATKPIWNYETAQWVRMRPASGEIEVWARR